MIESFILQGVSLLLLAIASIETVAAIQCLRCNDCPIPSSGNADESYYNLTVQCPPEVTTCRSMSNSSWSPLSVVKDCGDCSGHGADVSCFTCDFDLCNMHLGCLECDSPEMCANIKERKFVHCPDSDHKCYGLKRTETKQQTTNETEKVETPSPEDEKPTVIELGCGSCDQKKTEGEPVRCYECDDNFCNDPEPAVCHQCEDCNYDDVNRYETDAQEVKCSEYTSKCSVYTLSKGPLRRGCGSCRQIKARHGKDVVTMCIECASTDTNCKRQKIDRHCFSCEDENCGVPRAGNVKLCKDAERCIMYTINDNILPFYKDCGFCSDAFFDEYLPKRHPQHGTYLSSCYESTVDRSNMAFIKTKNRCPKVIADQNEDVFMLNDELINYVTPQQLLGNFSNGRFNELPTFDWTADYDANTTCVTVTVKVDDDDDEDEYYNYYDYYKNLSCTNSLPCRFFLITIFVFFFFMV